MPAPSYPAECRRKGQTGTVVVEFTVDSSGRVIAAHAKSESPWPLLNHEAVRTVRRWKFPPGGIMKLQRPIVFQLR
jgi:protein TonB